MHYNTTYFNCTIDNSCEQNIGYIKSNITRMVFVFLSSLSVLSNLVFIIYNLLKKNKAKNRKASMRKLFLIFPFTDILSSIYWLISFIYFNNLKKIEEHYKFCSIISVFYIDITTFQFTLMNFLLYHFRKMNTNPIEGILKPNAKFILYIITCFILGGVVSGISESKAIIGRSPLNTCFINTKYSGWFGFIFIIPLICIILVFIQLIHDLFFVHMFNSDKGIRRIHKKNSLYVFFFCLLHIPFIILMLISFVKKENNFYNKKSYKNAMINITTFLTCITPLIINILRQTQGLARFACVNDCLKNQKKAKLLDKKKLNPVRRLTTMSKISKDDPSMASDPFEWVENHIMEYFMRDILLGVSVSINESKIYDIYSSDDIELTNKDFKDYSKFEINFNNYKDYHLDDESIERSEYLNVKVISYAPKCFSYLRKLEKINIDNMIQSFLPKNNTQGIKKSQGKSGSFFISTDDNKYMIKTLKSDELELLKHAFLKDYINHIKKNPNSLLCRLYGMYNIILGQGDEILIIVMRNVIGDFKDNTIVKFDLKGSTYKRKANFDMANSNNVMKDLDFNEFEKGIMLSLSSIKKLRETTEKDSKFLCKSGLMDYSLFLVKLTLSKNEAEDVFGDKIVEKQNNDYIQIISDNYNINQLKRKSTYSGGQGNIHDVEHYKIYLFPSLNQGTAYIISIIDYFQIFNFFKYVESSIKTNFFQKKKKKIISCVDPLTYSDRFIKYIVSLTDVKQFLSNEIKEAPKEEENEDLEISDDDDSEEEESIFKKYKKKGLSLENKHKNNYEFLLPIEVRPENQSYVNNNNKIYI